MKKRVMEAYCLSDKIVRDADYKPEQHTYELMKRNIESTPDFLSLKYRQHIPVFVYGTLKMGGRLQHQLGGCPYLGDAQTCTSRYKMYDSGNFPVVLDETGGGKIYGEVYVVDPVKLLDLDYIEDNGNMYKREEVWVWMYDQSIIGKDGKRVVPSMKAWLYMGSKEFWEGWKLKEIQPKRQTTGPVYDYDVTSGQRYAS